jgi:hypothetical protein
MRVAPLVLTFGLIGCAAGPQRLAKQCGDGAESSCRTLDERCAKTRDVRGELLDCWSKARSLAHSQAPVAHDTGMRMLSALCYRAQFFCQSMHDVALGMLRAGDSRWLEVESTACNQGSATACTSLGLAYYEGQTADGNGGDWTPETKPIDEGAAPPRDPEKALEAFMKGCKIGARRGALPGDPDVQWRESGRLACEKASAMLKNGDGVPAEPDLAADFADRAQSVAESEGRSSAAFEREVVRREQRDAEREREREEERQKRIEAFESSFAQARAMLGQPGGSTSGGTGNGSNAGSGGSTSTSTSAAAEEATDIVISGKALSRWASGIENANVFARSECLVDMRRQCSAKRGAESNIDYKLPFCSEGKDPLLGKVFRCGLSCTMTCRVRR